MFGRLLTEDFLLEGMRRAGAYGELHGDARDAIVEALGRQVAGFLRHHDPNEAVTESELIYPVLGVLGWQPPLVQQHTGRRRTDVPDALLFAAKDARQSAIEEKESHRRYAHGTTFVEAKRWQRPLDRGEATDRTDPEVPSNQMLRYLSQVEVASGGDIVWGILTNGRQWRLYHQRSTNRAEEFLELDLPWLLGLAEALEPVAALDDQARQHLLTCFLLLLRPDAFLADPQLDGRSFLEYARREARLWEARVAESLSEVVFEQVYPRLIQGFVSRDRQRPTLLDDAYLAAIRDAALVFLYRLLFVLYAEDRDLLPVRDKRYTDYSLRGLRREIFERLDSGHTFSTTQTRYHGQLTGLFRALAVGDDSIGLPPYNGGLFDASQHPVLERLTLADADLAAVLDALSRRDGETRRLWINYRDLSVQQLGSIYERLLEHKATSPDGEAIEVQQTIYSRRTTGSYYTPESLVQLILERTLTPLVKERRQVFLTKLEELTGDRRRYAIRLAELAKLDPASRVLELNVVDPAMGSGHFLVSAVDFLADRTLELVSQAEQAVAEADWREPYVSPLQERLAAIRARVLEQAQEHGWPVDEHQLDDRHLVRRILLKRVIYGVDLNPMAVELAKLSLWLHTFTVGAPLSFLDHHLRCGNSLLGARVEEVRDRMERSGIFGATYAGMLQATEVMHDLETMTDADLAEVKASGELFEQLERDLRPYRRLMALDTSDPWFGRKEQKKGELTGADVLSGFYRDPRKLIDEPSLANRDDVRDLVESALAADDSLRFFPWQLMFPEVWYEKARAKEHGGFDAVIGNPPWDRIKLQQVEFFAERRPEIAAAHTAAERRRKIQELEAAGDPLWKEYEIAADQAARLATYARESGHFPLLSQGDINLYALFVERAYALIQSRGMVGLLVPSGIAADYYKGEFFGSLATGGRLAALLDFENKKRHFPDVDSRFKFSVFVGGGPDRTFDAADCAFFLHSAEELIDPERSTPLTPEDFARVNPNTRTAPVFRTARDAAITTDIYRRLPVLVDRTGKEERNPWGIEYLGMFHMTNDSARFRTAAQMEAEGFYPVDDNRWKRGDDLYLPLYEGKMVQMYDHRAAGVEVDTRRSHRPAQGVSTSEEQHGDPSWSPRPQYWVPLDDVASAFKSTDGSFPNWLLGFKHITSPTNQRSMIASLIPRSGAGNSLPILDSVSATRAALLLSCLNSFALDFVLRQKLQGQNLNLYILEQLPVPPPDAFDAELGGHSIRDLVEDWVLKLSYTAHDLAPFARDLGHDGGPHPWDEEARRHLMARLDALMFRLYGITDEDDIRYILSTFPIIQRHDTTRPSSAPTAPATSSSPTSEPTPPATCTPTSKHDRASSSSHCTLKP